MPPNPVADHDEPRLSLPDTAGLLAVFGGLALPSCAPCLHFGHRADPLYRSPSPVGAATRLG